LYNGQTDIQRLHPLQLLENQKSKGHVLGQGIKPLDDDEKTTLLTLAQLP
jgi:hypothetical protein